MEQEITTNLQDLPFVSILMVNYNGAPHVEEFFESAFNLNYPEEKYEVVVIDNASTDGSPDWIKQNYPRVKLVHLNKNYGWAVANNTGVNYCKGDFLALPNNDTVLDKNWLLELIRQAVRDPNAIYGSKMLWYSKPDYIVYAGGKLFAWGDAYHLQCYAKDSNEQNQPFLTMYADLCGALIPKGLYSKLGGAEESYFAVAEDYELSWKAWLLGYKVYFVPTAKFCHKVGATIGRRSKAHVYFLLRNQLRNMIKFAELPTLMVMYPLFMVYYLALYLAVYCFQEKNFYLILPILRAYLKIIAELPALIKVRRKFQKQRKISDRELKRLGLILTLGQSIREALAIFHRKSKFWVEAEP